MKWRWRGMMEIEGNPSCDLNSEGIPAELKSIPNWVNWTQETRNGKATKIPINPKTGKFAKSNDPSTWRTFDEAKQTYFDCENESIGGIGFMFSSSGLWR